MTVTKRLIIANIAVFLGIYLLGLDPASVYASYGLIPAEASVLTVVTSMFLHAGFWHLAANMIFLWFFGRLAETRLGSRRFGWMYALSGVGAAVAQIALDPTSVIPMVGASGAVSGALGAAIVLAPRERVMIFTPFTLFIPITMSIATFGLFWLGMQLFGLLGGAGGIAFMAHLGGFAVGWLFTRGARPRATRRRPRVGSAPNPNFRTFFVTDSRGRTFAYHEPR